MASRYKAFWYEDLGPRGDLTSKWFLDKPGQRVEGRIFAREPVVASGVNHAVAILREKKVRVASHATDGHKVPKNHSLVKFHGPARGVLAAERLVLNILGRMCAIATTTRRLQDKAAKANPKCRVAGTRKTTPGFRAYEKEAIRHGGGEPHRFGLYDAILVKDNHRALVDDLGAAIEHVMKKAKGLPVEVEVESVGDARLAAEAGVDWILIDNQTPAAARRIAKAARDVDPDVRVEASGGLDEKNLAKYAPFADRLSLGLLTHSVDAVDVTLEIKGRR